MGIYLFDVNYLKGFVSGSGLACGGISKTPATAEVINGTVFPGSPTWRQKLG